MRHIFISVIAMTLLFNLLSAQTTDSTLNTLKTGSDAPNFYLKDIQNNDMFLRDYCGAELRQPWKNKTKHVVILSFFATWCAPCLIEIPYLEDIQNKYADQPVKFFLIDVGEKKPEVESFLKQKGYKLPVLLDIYKMVTVEKYKVSSIPQLVVISKEGKILLIKNGFKDKESLYSELIPAIDNELKKDGS
ncbi:MAG: TlpA family protein disulfide reductase [Calditrichaceae bacterium]|nr:TlpA family protein disulfide reductase [Calditrichaceae bacterium]